ncbi:hypothetical protein [Marinococcus luteus]|uniref:hypothetical protein n=1 Tax=Marinococcus luteus TaxID=1122204 RepID=UPI002ACCA46A|nr:hypothetical protein [Marinococcus luteus]MDZ5782400.1 hypothetical protein [Marinococcus luteus]
MLIREYVCVTTVAARLPYIAEEVYQAWYGLHAMEYQIWKEWRRSWNQQESPTEEESLRQAVFDVSGRQGLSVPVIQEIVSYTEKQVWLAMMNGETKY